MAQVKKQLTELIGHTPLLELERLEKAHNTQARIIAKLEYFNPGGSVKDHIALAMIEDAEKRGVLKEGATIIEPTSGNTGVGLAWVASVKRLQNHTHHAGNHEYRTSKPTEGVGSSTCPHPRKQRNERSH